MNEKDATVSDIARLSEASDWVQRLSASTDQTLTDEWVEWCRSDHRNLTAFERMQSIWDGFAVAPESAVAPLPAERGYAVRRYVLIGLAASILLVAAGFAWFVSRPAKVEEFITKVGEQRAEVLDDGSRLMLAPDSQITVRYTNSRRDVQLQRGHVFFAVAHNWLRPFVVHAGELTVTAVGTAFDVRNGDGNVVVTVSEGSVQVDPDAQVHVANLGVDAAIYGAIHAQAGQQLTYSKPARRLSLGAVDLKTAESWREGVLQFSAEPLQDVVAEVNRYSPRRIVLSDPDLAQKRFTGTVSEAHVDEWLKALEFVFPVETVDQGARGVLIRPRTRQDTER